MYTLAVPKLYTPVSALGAQQNTFKEYHEKLISAHIKIKLELMS